jgi:hypothetical protein
LSLLEFFFKCRKTLDRQRDLVHRSSRLKRGARPPFPTPSRINENFFEASQFRVRPALQAK